MKKHTTILLLLIAIQSFGQPTDNDSEKYRKIISEKAQIDAQNDIKYRRVSIFIQGGIAPVTTAEDLEIAKKYGIRITEYGCVGLDREYSVSYNQEIYRHLDREFGDQ